MKEFSFHKIHRVLVKNKTFIVSNDIHDFNNSRKRSKDLTNIKKNENLNNYLFLTIENQAPIPKYNSDSETIHII